ncbi:hypothetical protein D5281_15685 [bacterium 1xD42-62]|uniref:Uncharacterized protein n=1 Tax=Parablautia muri TaxID=2320879 RepID=A0A9X5BHX6_9FIRM|nr:hypothetical protein [Parablautia muri]
MAVNYVYIYEWPGREISRVFSRKNTSLTSSNRNKKRIFPAALSPYYICIFYKWYYAGQSIFARF